MNKTNRYLLPAFLIPFGGMLLVMLAGACMPFGTNSMMFADVYDQYYPFFLAYRRAVHTGDLQNLLYTWEIGMGMDFLGLIAYYLMSPFCLLGVLLPEKMLLGYFCLLMPIKLGLAGMAFAYMLRKLFGPQYGGGVAIFAGFYGLCAWALGYNWNVLWLDTFALLPLAVVGTVSLLKEGKYRLYAVTLAASILCNYVMGLFTCIFILLLFFVYEVCRWAGWEKFFRDLLRIAVVTILAIGVTAAVELPAFMSLQTTAAISAGTMPQGFQLNIAQENTLAGLLDALRQVIGNLGGSLRPTFLYGNELPNIHCGVGSVFLMLLYFMNRKISWKEKICALALLASFVAGFLFKQLDFILHGFHINSQIPYRFSFLVSFVILYMAYRAWQSRENCRPGSILAAAVLSLAIFACSDGMKIRVPLIIGSFYQFIPTYMVYNFTFVMAYMALLLWDSLGKPLPGWKWLSWLRKRNVSSMVLLVMGIELAANLICFSIYYQGLDISDYPKGTEDTAAVVSYMQAREAENPFYRTETTHAQTQNDPALIGYHGASTFVSTANAKTIEYMRALGYSSMDWYIRYLYEEGSPLSDLFLGIKYRISREESDRSSRFFQEVYRSGDVALLENQRYLPLGFLADPELAELPFSMETAGGPFQFQNVLFQTISGTEEQLWHWVPGENLTVTAQGLSIQETAQGYTSFLGEGPDAALTYSYEITEEGFLCLYFTFPNYNSMNVLLNGELLYQEEIGPPQMLAVGDVKPGDMVQVQVLSYPGQEGSVTIEAAVMDCQLFDEAYEKLNTSTLELTSFESTHVEGKITCHQDGLLYTSIPQDGNWSAQVDGKDAEIQLVGDCMIGLRLSEGEHTVSFTYHNAAFSLGWKISLACAAFFLLLTLRDPKYRIRK